MNLTIATTLMAFSAMASENADGFTQENCQLTNEFYVPKLPGFIDGDKWPCSYAGTLPSNADGSH